MPVRKLFFFVSVCPHTCSRVRSTHSWHGVPCHWNLTWMDGRTDTEEGQHSTSQGLALQPNKHTVIDGFLVSDQCWASRQRTHLTTDGKVAAATIEFTVYEKTGQVFVQFYLLCMILFSLWAGRCMLHPALLVQHTSYRLTERLNRCRSIWLRFCIS